MNNHINTFRYWTKQTLPTVYDDTLSFYELLNKVVEHLNDVVSGHNELSDDVKDYIERFNELKSHVDNYFNNLDVQDEINEKLDELVQDGTMDTIINENIFDDLNEKINAITHNVKDFGAVGDGVTNDTEAFQTVSDILNQQGGGTLLIPDGTYLVGKQNYTPTGSYVWAGENIISLENGHSIVIKGNNATIKLIDDMRIGHFDQSTGDPVTDVSEVDSNTKNAFVNNLFNIKNYKHVHIEGLELDGQTQTYNVDGTVKTEYLKGLLKLEDEEGNTISSEVGAHGLQLINNEKVTLVNCDIHHFGVDGVYVGNQIGTNFSYEYDSNPVTLINVISEYNGRQGLSWAGGKGLTAISCKFNYTTKAGISYEPGAGVDVESNEGKVEDGFFINCEFANNKIGILATSSDLFVENLRFEKCRFYGTNGSAVRMFTKRNRFNDCFISGSITEASYGDNEMNKTHFVDCIITGEHSFYDNAIFGARLFEEVSNSSGFTSNPVFERCFFITGEKGLFNSSGDRITTLRNCHINKNNTFGASLNCLFEGKNIIEDEGNISFGGSLNEGTLHYKNKVITDDVNENGVWKSAFNELYFKGTSQMFLPNYAYSIILTCFEEGTSNYLYVIGSKTGVDSPFELETINSSVLSLGAKNTAGTLNIDGFTDVANARITVQLFSNIS